MPVLIYGQNLDSLISASQDLETDDALVLLLQSSHEVEQASSEVQAKYHTALSAHYLDQGVIDEAIKNALAAIEFAKGENNSLNIRCLNTAGEAYRTYQDLLYH
ncbi:MAG: hypothetical protein R2813_03540 [Flavobacteriales bacterium]